MDDKLDTKDVLPVAPEVTHEQWEKARKTGRYESIAFNEYKFVAQLVAVVARISKESEVFRKVPTQHYHVLIGLMNRCARLMLATLDLSHEGKFGETTAIVFRCIIETGVKIIWLCTKPSQERFDLYICDGLKPEIELKDTIISNIKNRGGEPALIERRMLESIERHIKAAEVTEQQIRESKKMPDAATLLLDTGFDRMIYVALLRMGAHHVHGTWPSLFSHYLEESEDGLIPRGNNVSTNAQEFVAAAFIMTKAMQSYCQFVLDEEAQKAFTALLSATERENLKIFDDMAEHGY